MGDADHLSDVCCSILLLYAPELLYFDPVCIGRIGADGRMYQIADTSLYHYSDRTSGNCGGGNICIYNVME